MGFTASDRRTKPTHPTLKSVYSGHHIPRLCRKIHQISQRMDIFPYQGWITHTYTLHSRRCETAQISNSQLHLFSSGTAREPHRQYPSFIRSTTPICKRNRRCRTTFQYKYWLRTCYPSRSGPTRKDLASKSFHIRWKDIRMASRRRDVEHGGNVIRSLEAMARSKKQNRQTFGWSMWEKTSLGRR